MNQLPYSGDDLRRRRETLGLSQADVFEEVRVPIRYVKALEDGEFAALPAAGYAVGFLRTYCRFLNLPSERYVDSFRASARMWLATPQAARTAPAQAANWRENLVTWAAICAVLLLGWIAYAMVVHPNTEATRNRVEAGTRDTTAPSGSFDFDF